MTSEDVADLARQLAAIKAKTLKGTGVYRVTYKVNDKMQFWAEPTILQDWTPSYEVLSESDSRKNRK